MRKYFCLRKRSNMQCSDCRVYSLFQMLKMSVFPILPSFVYDTFIVNKKRITIIWVIIWPCGDTKYFFNTKREIWYLRSAI